MTLDIDDLSADEFVQLKHWWCTQTSRRAKKCMLEGKMIWAGRSCKGCPYEITVEEEPAMIK